MIYYANLYINKIDTNNNLNFEYLIIDEYQDISEDRYILTKNIAKRNIAKVVAVGDDWQSIFAFAGSKIEYIYNFLNYFPGAKLLKITKTYRNSNELINYSGKFIMKNDDQIKKELISNKYIPNPIKFVTFNDEEEVAIKMESTKARCPQLRYEYNLYRILMESGESYTLASLPLTSARFFCRI